MQHISFNTHVQLLMPVVPAILMRNERHCSRTGKNVLGLLIIVMIVVKRLRAVYR